MSVMFSRGWMKFGQTFLGSHHTILKVPSKVHFSLSVQRYGIYTPEDLPPPGPPAYQPINLRIRGYDFTGVEHYMYYLTKLVHNVGVQATRRWATPCTSARVTTFKPGSNLVYNEYELNMFERNVEVSGMTVSTLALLLDIVNSTLPEGIFVTAKLTELADQEIREVPDYELVALKSQLAEIGQPARKSFKK